MNVTDPGVSAPVSPYKYSRQGTATAAASASSGVSQDWDSASISQEAYDRLYWEGWKETTLTGMDATYKILHKNGQTAMMTQSTAHELYSSGGIEGLLSDLYSQNLKKMTKEEAASAASTEKTLRSLQWLMQEKKELNSEINAVLKKAGLSDSQIRNVKIELTEDGKILVGGINNEKLIRKAQEQLVKSGLGGRIKTFQLEEKAMSKALFPPEGATIMNLETGTQGWDELVRRVKEAGVDENGELGDIGLIDTLWCAAADFLAIGGPDFSHGSKGLVDPLSKLNGTAADIQKKIKERLDIANTQNAQRYQDEGWSEEAIGKSAMSLKNVNISITADGQVKIEGRFSASDRLNSQAESLVNMVIQEVMGEQLTARADGSESDFATAARQLKMLHDDEFGVTDESDKTAVISIGDNKAEAYISAPGREESLRQDIRSTTASLVNSELGIDTLVANDFKIDDDGKIRLVAKPEGVEAGQINQILDQLNRQVKTGGSKGSADPYAAAAGSIAEKLAELATYGPEGGTAYARTHRPAIDPYADSGGRTQNQPTDGGIWKAATDAHWFDYWGIEAKQGNANGPVSEDNDIAQKNIERNRQLDDAMDRWLAGEGEFSYDFIGRTTADGYRLGYDPIREDIYTTPSNISVLIKLGFTTDTDKINAAFAEHMARREEAKGYKPEDFQFTDVTGLTQAGLTSEEREDFLNEVQAILDEEGINLDARQLGYVYRADDVYGWRDDKSCHYSDAPAQFFVNMTREFNNYAESAYYTNEHYGMRGNDGMGRYELEQARQRLTDRINVSAYFEEQGLVGKMTESRLLDIYGKDSWQQMDRIVPLYGMDMDGFYAMLEDNGVLRQDYRSRLERGEIQEIYPFISRWVD